MRRGITKKCLFKKIKLYERYSSDGYFSGQLQRGELKNRADLVSAPVTETQDAPDPE